MKSLNQSNGKSEVRLHSDKPKIEASPNYDTYIDIVGKGQDYESIEMWLDTLVGVENLNILLDDLKAGGVQIMTLTVLDIY